MARAKANAMLERMMGFVCLWLFISYLYFVFVLFGWLVGSIPQCGWLGQPAHRLEMLITHRHIVAASPSNRNPGIQACWATPSHLAD